MASSRDETDRLCGANGGGSRLTHQVKGDAVLWDGAARGTTDSHGSFSLHIKESSSAAWL